MRRCWPDQDRLDEYQFFVNGKAAGRCYFMIAANSPLVWRWTQCGSSLGGMKETLEEAQRRFKETYEAAKLQPR
jgi:hypothetical protein